MHCIQNKAGRQLKKKRKKKKGREDKRASEKPTEDDFKKKKKSLLVIGSVELKSPLSAFWLVNKQRATMASRFPRIWSTKGGQSSTQ